MMTKCILAAVTVLLSCPCYSQQLNADSLVAKSTALLMTGRDEDKAQVRQNIRLLATQESEAGLTVAARLAFVMGEYLLCDSISKIAAQKFPAGETARYQAYAVVANEKGGGKKTEAAYHNWVAQFPDTVADHSIYDDGRKYVAEQYAKERNYPQGNRFIAAITDTLEQGKQEIDNAVIALNNGDTAVAKMFQQSGIKRLQLIALRPGYPYVGSYYLYLDKYAQLLYRQRLYSKALTAITEVYNHTREASPALNKTYASILTANRKGKQALPLLEQLFIAGKGDEPLQQVLQTAYRQKNGSISGYNTYLEKLKAAMKKQVKAKPAPQLLQLPAPAFALQDMEGNTVSLAQLAGKVVILDFWATWCGPCKRSFPAMKRVVQKYQADTAVHFLFIDCMEHNGNYAAVVKDYITSNHYPFHVLFDNGPERVFEQYGVKGIPAKFIIDGNGIIRYKLVGMEEGDDAAVEELSTLIETARKQPKP